MRSYICRIEAMDACQDALDWLREQDHPTLQGAWDVCERADWMLWYAGKQAGGQGSTSRRRIVLAACECARTALPIWAKEHPDDNRPLFAIETAEAWARGGRGAPNLEDVRDAAASAADAAAAAAAAYAASAAAAYAADAAAYAADAAADAAVRRSALKEMADTVRKHYPKPPRKAPND